MSVLSSIEPQNVFHYFEEICSIPHGSGHTDVISNYLTAFAEAHELKYIKDASNNVIIFKPGTSGYETSAPVILQGHMDMVAVKEKDCPINMDTDGLKLKLENGIISAEGTTLGGDDGIAVAFALAILDSHDIPHPPLEAVFTVDEEIGMLGAAALDCSPLSSRIMLNLDSEDEGYLLVSCAGGATADVQIPVIWENTNEKASAYKLSVSHACGGHSGVEINKQSANASKVLGRVLNALANDFDMKLSTLSGGLKDNAIPTDAEAVVIFSDTDMSDINTPDHANIPANSVHSSLQDLISKWNQIIRHEYTHTDPDICITLEPVDLPAATMTDTSTHTVIDVLMTYPNGVRKMSKDIAGAIEDGVVKDGDTFYCKGYEIVADGTDPIYCHNRTGDGTLTLKQALEQSCNVALMQIAKSEGKEIKTINNGTQFIYCINAKASSKYKYHVTAFNKIGKTVYKGKRSAAASTVKTTQKVKVACGVLNVRKGANTSSKILTTVTNGKTLTVKGIRTSRGTNWYKVSFKKGRKSYTGYVSADYVNLK